MAWEPCPGNKNAHFVDIMKSFGSKLCNTQEVHSCFCRIFYVFYHLYIYLTREKE